MRILSIALLGLWASLARTAVAQQTCNGGATCPLNVSATATINSVARLSISSTTTALTTPTVSDFGAVAGVNSSGPTSDGEIERGLHADRVGGVEHVERRQQQQAGVRSEDDGQRGLRHDARPGRPELERNERHHVHDRLQHDLQLHGRCTRQLFAGREVHPFRSMMIRISSFTALSSFVPHAARRYIAVAFVATLPGVARAQFGVDKTELFLNPSLSASARASSPSETKAMSARKRRSPSRIGTAPSPAPTDFTMRARSRSRVPRRSASFRGH